MLPVTERSPRGMCLFSRCNYKNWLWDNPVRILKKEEMTAGLCCQVVPEGLGSVSLGISKGYPEGRTGKINCTLMMVMRIYFIGETGKEDHGKIITNNAQLGKGWWEDWDSGKQDMEPGSPGSGTKPRRAGRVPQIPLPKARSTLN